LHLQGQNVGPYSFYTSPSLPPSLPPPVHMSTAAAVAAAAAAAAGGGGGGGEENGVSRSPSGGRVLGEGENGGGEEGREDEVNDGSVAPGLVKSTTMARFYYRKSKSSTQLAKGGPGGPGAQPGDADAGATDQS